MDNKAKAQEGLLLLEKAFWEEIKQKGGGLTQADLATSFEIRDRSVDSGWLEWAVCHRLRAKNKIKQGREFDPPRRPAKGWWSVD